MYLRQTRQRLNDIGDAAVIGADHLAQILGSSRVASSVEPTRSQT